MSEIITVGIDPGLTGAMAGLGPSHELQFIEDLPTCTDAALEWIDGHRLCQQLSDCLRGRRARFVVERVSAMPDQGVSSSFKFGVTFGSILAALQVYGAPIHLVTPVSWKRAMGLTRVQNETTTQAKHRALDKARLLYPAGRDLLARVKDHGRAEALLLAHHHLVTLRGAP